MEKAMYDEMRQQQDSHWWYCARKEIVLDVAEKIAGLKCSDSCPVILDAGCGMGVILDKLVDYGDTYGMDMDAKAVSYCRDNYKAENPSAHIKQGSLPENIPFAEGSFDMIFALDVLEHIEDDNAAVKAIAKLLKKDGKLILTVPALMSLWSGHDVLNRHFRRYNKKELVKVIQDAGLKIIKCSYYDSFLFLPAFMVRKIKNLLKINSSDISMTSKGKVINTILMKIFAGEKCFLRKHGFPVGVSLILVAKI